MGKDTLRSPPPENETMKRASVISICITTFLYLSCGGLGYAAFGDQTPGNLLTGFGFYEPYWLIDFANACIILHLFGGYQVGNNVLESWSVARRMNGSWSTFLNLHQMYSQPVFGVMDKWNSENTSFINRSYNLKLPLLPNLDLNLRRLFFRTTYVVSTTGIAMFFPYFNEVLGVLGAVNFWPLAIYFPVEMRLRQRRMGSWTRKWIVLRGFSVVCFILTMFALVGSIQGLIAAKLR